jgi:CMP-N,N'-diacetyllegionaminic acid synthase
MNVVAFIFARSGSKGLKNKNLLKLKNKSLLGNAILQAKKSIFIKKIFVSTDSLKIKKEAIKYGALVPFLRPKELASDKSPEISSWKHAVNFLNQKLNIYPDYIISVPTTSPLRKISDINKCIAKAVSKKLDLVIAITESQKNPYFNMIELKNNKFQIIKKNKKYSRRQDAPKCFDITTACYVFKSKYIKKTKNIFSGRIGYVKIPRERALDIDNYLDYKIAKLLIK